MHKTNSFLFSKQERFLVLAVTIGSILEWHEVFLYVYWAPIISDLYLYAAIPTVNLINFILLFATAWIARPLGGIIFGYIGDRWGRKIAFITSILLISIPSILTWFVASFVTWGVFALLFFAVMRLFQGIPAGGEIPGVICYFSENSTPDRKNYLCSYTFVGSNIGQLLSLIECLLLKKYLSTEDLLAWGWKLSFLVGGILGIGGIIIRNRLQESIAFKKAQKNNSEVELPIKKCFRIYWKRIVLCFGFSAIQIAGSYLFTVFPYEHFSHIFHFTENQYIAMNVYFITVAIMLIPLFGYFINYQNRKNILILSALSVILLSIPLYYSINHSLLAMTLVLGNIILVFLCIMAAFLPLMLSQLFPTEVRFTGIGFGFNICDSLILGAAPLLTHTLLHIFGSAELFIIGIPLLGILFIYSLSIFERPLFRKY